MTDDQCVCQVCGRRLRTPESVARKVGPVCAGPQPKRTPTSNRQCHFAWGDSCALVARNEHVDCAVPVTHCMLQPTAGQLGLPNIEPLSRGTSEPIKESPFDEVYQACQRILTISGREAKYILVSSRWIKEAREWAQRTRLYRKNDYGTPDTFEVMGATVLECPEVPNDFVKAVWCP